VLPRLLTNWPKTALKLGGPLGADGTDAVGTDTGAGGGTPDGGAGGAGGIPDGVIDEKTLSVLITAPYSTLSLLLFLTAAFKFLA
jgi:hypothetical protein